MIRSFLTKHALGIAWSQAGNRVARLVAALLVFRVLDADGANRFMWLFSAAMVASVLSDFGLRNTVYARVGRLDRDQLRTYLGEVYGWKLTASLGILILFPAYIHWIHDEPWLVAFLAALLSVNLFVSDPGVQILRGVVLGHLEFVVFVVDSLLPLVFMLALWFFGWDSLALVVAVWALTSVMRSVLTFALVKRYVSEFSFCRSPSRLRALVADKTAAGVVLLIFMLHLRFPVLAAPYLGIEEQTGLIAALLMILQSFQIIPGVVSNVLIPLLYKDDRGADVSKLVAPCLALNVVAGGVVAVVLFFLAAPILMLLDPNLAAGAHLLRLSVLSLPFVCANQMLRLLAIAVELKTVLVVSMGSSVLASIAMITSLSLSHGARGAIIGYILSEVLLFAVLCVLVTRRGAK